MDRNPHNTSQSAGSQTAGQPQTGEKANSERTTSPRTSSPITPELVSQLADQVLAMLRLEMKIEKERYPRRMNLPRSTRGGW